MDDDEGVSPNASPGIPQPPQLAPAQSIDMHDMDDQRQRNALLRLLDTEDGQTVIDRILDQCKPYELNRQPDDHSRGIQEGERRIGLWLIMQIQSLNHFAYANLLRSRAERAQRAEAEFLASQEAERMRLASMPSWQRQLERAKRYTSSMFSRKS